MNWHQPNPKRNHYWQSDRYDFWITSKRVWKLNDDPNLVPTQSLDDNYVKWILFNGTDELGVYDTLQEAQNAAEPAHGVNESPDDAPVCYWCQGSHPGQICKDAPYFVGNQENP